MPDVVIENPVINSPFEEPRRHFVFGDDGITDQLAESRRASSYFVPIAAPRKKGAQLTLQEVWTAERLETNTFINRVRERVSLWRQGDYQGVTAVTRTLIGYWRNKDRNRRLFFCQLEALETAIYIAEVASRYGDSWLETTLKSENEVANPGLDRIAFKMATGSGKTVVMAMIIAWQALNKFANPRDRRFTDTFLVVTPGITIRDRLRVLLPSDPANYYVQHDIVTPDQLQQIQRARILITNFHAFLRREKLEAAALTKRVLAGPGGDIDRFKETSDEMVRRVCRDLGPRKNIMVINDEAHHCYREKQGELEGKLTADEKAEVKANVEAARVWISGLEAVKAKMGLKTIYDLSATPFFLRGSGYPEGTLFPWVVSDFSLIDAIESGIVKVPRVPVADNQMTGTLPTYRDLWRSIRDGLPRRGRTADSEQAEPRLPKELEGALQSLYSHYEKTYKPWKDAGFETPPVFIVVCSNTSVSKRVFDWIAGWEKTLSDGNVVLVPGQLKLFSNVENGAWTPRPNTLLIDSAQLESGGAMDDAFKKMAAPEIRLFKDEYRLRTGRDPEQLTDEDLLREVMNTVGKRDKLGAHVRCVVSVSMLTEGWDANTVTHILGVRAFGTQLLCEQVVGRGLRRASYETNETGHFDPEYAEVYGVPFSFIPAAGATKPKLARPVHRVRAMDERSALEITFPRITGYRYEMTDAPLRAEFTKDSEITLSTQDVPTAVDVEPIAGEKVVHTLDDLRHVRTQAVAFRIARRTLDDHLRDPEGAEKPWLFPQVLAIVRRWLELCVTCKDATFPQMLLLGELERDAAERVYRSIVRGTEGTKKLVPILRAFDPVGSTRFVAFDTTKEVYATNADRCHLNYVALDSGWEAKLASVLEGMDEVVSYVKNQGLNFTIPYTFEGKSANYLPDYIVRVNDGHAEPLNLIVEVSGEAKKEKAAKVAVAKTFWVPSVNNGGAFGRWSYLEVSDPWDASNLIRAHIREMRSPALVGP
jgi:type III restriction enzyme